MECGTCAEGWHDTISGAWACLEAAEDARIEAESEAEWEAEQANERWFETRGDHRSQIEEDMEHSPFDPIWG